MRKLAFYLIASETNDYKPWIMTSKAMAFFIVIVWGTRILIPASITFAASFMDPHDLMNRINDERSKRFVTTLATNDKLILAAQGKSDDMLHRSYFSHVDPDGNYVWPRIEASGYKPYITLGENLAMDFSSPDDLVSAWMNSPTHRSNILNDKFKDQGLALTTGLYEANHTTTLVASLFGTLSKPAVTPTPAPTPTPTPTPPKKISSSTQSQTPSSPTITINNNADVSVTQVSGHILIDLDIQISGSPTLVTARLKSQSITLLPKDSDHFTGTFNFDSTEQLNGENATVEARNAAGIKTTSSIAISGVETQAASIDTQTPPSKIPVSQEAMLVNILRIIFGILSVIYLGFLVTDAIIIHRAKVDRPGAHITPQIIIFILIATVNLFAGKF